MKMNKALKTLLKLAFLLIFTILSLYIVFKDDYKDIMKVLGSSSPLYIILAILCMLLVFFIDGCILTIIANSFTKGYKLHQGIINQQYCNFFNGITPLATGGEPIQIYLFKKQGLSISKGLGVILIYFILFKFALLSFATFAFIYNYSRLNALVDQSQYNLLFILIISFSIIASLSIFVILLAYLPLFKKLFHKIINLLHKIKLVKDVERAHIIFDEKMASIRTGIKHIFTNWKIIIPLLGLMFIRFFILYSIPFITFYAINNHIDGKYFLDSISLASYTTLISGVFPSPGGSIGVELAYTYLFKGFFANKLNTLDVDATIKSSMLIWRCVTFYLGLILGAFVVLIYKPRKKYNRNEKIKSIEPFEIKENDDNNE